MPYAPGLYKRQPFNKAIDGPMHSESSTEHSTRGSTTIDASPIYGAGCSETNIGDQKLIFPVK